ncbi:MAG: tetratricopeptide repeat protein [Candidatus Zixiibacteriota bacterium]
MARKSQLKKSSGSVRATKDLAARPTSAADLILHAEKLYDRNQHQEAMAILTPLEQQYPFADGMLTGRFDRLMTFVYTHLKRYSDAEQIIRRGQETHPGALDFLFAACYIKVAMREYAVALEQGQKFLLLASKLEKSSRSPLDSTVGQIATVHNYIGTARQELGDIEGALESFSDAIAQDPGQHLPYLNKVSLLAHQRRWEEANQTIEQGLKKCRNINELRMLAETYRKRATVSACIMVKNEEEMLPGCLDSLRNWVDEIIVVDTGSTDRSVEIAQQYGAKIFHHPWANSFSEARNHTLEHATCDWLFIIDADERVFEEDVPQLIQMLNQDQFPMVAVNVFNYYPLSDDIVTFLPSKRLFRRSLNLSYSGIVHNQLLVPENVPAIKTGIRIKHFGYGLSKERMEAKIVRTKALLEKQLEVNPDDAFALFNYAQLHRSSPDGFKPENATVVLKAAGRAIEITSPDNPENRHIFYMCLDQLAWTHYYLKDYDKAEECSLRALATKPSYLDPLLLLGYVFYAKNELVKAREYFEKYLAAQAAYNPADETENIILVNLGGRADALFNLGVLAEMAGEKRQARDYFAETLRINPRYHSANLALARYYLQENEIDLAAKYFAAQVEVGKHIVESRLALAAIATQKEKFEEALQHYSQVLESTPNHVSAVTESARCLIKLNRTAEAVRVLESSVKAGCSDENVLALLAESSSQVGAIAQAIGYYTTLIKKYPDSPVYINDLANCHYRQGEFDQAETLYRKALDLGVAAIETRRNLGLTLARQQRGTEAISELKQYLRECPGDADVQHVLGDLYLSAGSAPDALTHFEQYLRQNPNDGRAFFRLAECYLLMGHKDSAILGYQRSLQLDPQLEMAQSRLQGLLELIPKA